MKNYWLIMGGVSLGLALAYSIDDKKSKNDAIFQLIAGSLIVGVGIYGFKHK